MSDKSTIEWTDATWNPTTGCTKVSEACAHCYIERTPPFRIAGRKFVKGHIPIEFHPDRIDTPLKWKKPRRIFVNSLSDLFHDDIPNEYIVDVFTTMYEAQWHTFQMLTKRPQRMAELLSNPRFPWAIGCRAWSRMSEEKKAVLTRKELIADVMDNWPLPNLWCGITAENQKRFDERAGYLEQTPAAVRFLSCEPLLGLINLGTRRFDWIIAGGESGPNARPTHPEWVRSLLNQSQGIVYHGPRVPFHFKQWGEWGPRVLWEDDVCPCGHGNDQEHELRGGLCDRVKLWNMDGGPAGYEPRIATASVRLGKKNTGRLLDGREWNEFPEVKHV